jgi:hypothetical protein
VSERNLHATDRWLQQLLGRRPKHVAAVALANKNARIAWALLAHESDFRPAGPAAATAGA